MAVTLNKLVHLVLNPPNGGVTNNETKMNKREAAEWIASYRATLVSNEMSKRNKISPETVQTIRCVPLIKVDVIECCEGSDTYECTILRTEDKVPITLSRGGKPTYIAVESIDGLHTFSRLEFFRRKWLKYNKFTSVREGYYLQNDYMYIITRNPLLKKINISGVFADPLELERYNTCEDVPCFSWDQNYPLEQDMVAPICNMIWKDVMRIVIATPQDHINNNRADLKP